MANEQETQLPSTPSESADAASALAPKKLEQPATWPGNVPTQAQALEVLRGKLTLALSLPSARKLQEKLTRPEREALLDEGLADCLCEALAVRWRLAAAQDLLLTAGGKVDAAALNALLAEVDQALEALRAATPATPDLGLAIDRTWETLTQEAVDFSSSVKAASNPVAAPTPRYSGSVKPVAAGKVTFQEDEPQDQQQGKRRSRTLQLVALAVVALGVGAYHVVTTMQAQNRPSNYAGAPNNTLVTTDAKTGTLVVRSMLIGPTPPELHVWLKQQEARGMRVKELQPGTWLLTPATPAPATAGNTNP